MVFTSGLFQQPASDLEKHGWSSDAVAELRGALDMVLRLAHRPFVGIVATKHHDGRLVLHSPRLGPGRDNPAALQLLFFETKDDAVRKLEGYIAAFVKDRAEEA